MSILQYEGVLSWNRLSGTVSNNKKNTFLLFPLSKMSRSAIKRLMTEYKEITLNSPEGITAGPIDEDNFFIWEALIA